MSAVQDDISGDGEGESTRKIVIRLRDEAKRREGASTVWRAGAGIAATVAIALGGAALVYAQQAAVDHDAVMRHERELDGNEERLVQIQEQIAALSAVMTRVERQLDERSSP